MSETIQVTSTCVASLEEDTDTLVVDFTDGSHYTYFGVTAEKFKDFVLSSSKGQFFNSQIRGKYAYSGGR